MTRSSFSTDDGHFEEAQYRYNANPADPRCITAFILWQHGRYQLNNNGSLSLFPFSADGRIQVQDPCAAVTNLITYYDQMVSRLSARLVEPRQRPEDKADVESSSSPS
jgi:hypothetical protein